MYKCVLISACSRYLCIIIKLYKNIVDVSQPKLHGKKILALANLNNLIKLLLFVYYVIIVIIIWLG